MATKDNDQKEGGGGDAPAKAPRAPREKKEGQVFALELFKQLEPYTALVQYNTGQFTAPVAYRNSLTGVPAALLLVAWNIEKK